MKIFPGNPPVIILAKFQFHLWICFFSLLWMTAWNPLHAQVSGNGLNSADSLVVELQKIPIPDRPKIKENPSIQFATGINEKNVKFSLAQLPGLENIPFNSIPWFDAVREASAEENEQVAYFFLPGEAIHLGSTHIRSEWLAKGFPGRNTEEELHQFIKTYFLSPIKNGKLINEYSVTTQNHQSVKVLAIFIPEMIKDSVKYQKKYCAWAWVNTGNSFIGFCLSSTEVEKYKAAYPLFLQMLMSFKKEE